MNITNKTVDPRQYDQKWIEETWGWDTPDEFVRSKGAHLRPRVRYSLALADLKPGMRVLDVGCGRGEVVLHCGRQKIYALGIDYSEHSIDIANKAKKMHAPDEQENMHFICDDIKNLENEKPFDRIFLLDLVEHLFDWELNQLFAVCETLLAPDGEIIIHTLPNRWVYEITYRRLLRIFMPWLPADPRSEKEKAIHVNEMTVPHLSSLLRNNGLKHKIWLEELITQQARWHTPGTLGDKRSKLYQLMRSPLIALLYRMACLTPLRLLVANDIFAVAKKEGSVIKYRKPMRRNLTEELTIRLKK